MKTKQTHRRHPMSFWLCSFESLERRREILSFVCIISLILWFVFADISDFYSRETLLQLRSEAITSIGLLAVALIATIGYLQGYAEEQAREHNPKANITSERAGSYLGAVLSGLTTSVVFHASLVQGSSSTLMILAFCGATLALSGAYLSSKSMIVKAVHTK